MALLGLGQSSPRRRLFRYLTSPNDTSLADVNNTDDYYPSELFRYKSPKVFVCVPSHGFEKFFRFYIPIFDILLVAAIPFILLCFTNIGIITFTMRNNRRMRQHRKRSHRRHQRLTIMLLSVTLAFIGLTCPSVIFICVNKIMYSPNFLQRKNGANDGSNPGPPPNAQIIVDLCEALWYTKHAMNFILYTLSGQDFRREFLKLFTHCFNHRLVFLRKKILNETQASALASESTFDTQVPTPTSYRKASSRRKPRAFPITDGNDLSKALCIHSASTEFKCFSEEQLV